MQFNALLQLQQNKEIILSKIEKNREI